MKYKVTGILAAAATLAYCATAPSQAQFEKMTTGEPVAEYEPDFLRQVPGCDYITEPVIEKVVEAAANMEPDSILTLPRLKSDLDKATIEDALGKYQKQVGPLTIESSALSFLYTTEQMRAVSESVDAVLENPHALFDCLNRRGEAVVIAARAQAQNPTKRRNLQGVLGAVYSAQDALEIVESNEYQSLLGEFYDKNSERSNRLTTVVQDPTISIFEGIEDPLLDDLTAQTEELEARLNNQLANHPSDGFVVRMDRYERQAAELGLHEISSILRQIL